MMNGIKYMNQRKNFEQYKRILRFLAAMFLVAAQTVVFAFCWYSYFNQELRKPYENKGNLLIDRKSTRLNSSHVSISYAVFCLKKKKKKKTKRTYQMYYKKT